MASGVLTSHAHQVNGSTHSDTHSREISDYEKIIRLHDEILAGTHPRLKIPAQLVGKLPQRSVQTSAAISPRPAAANVKPPPVVINHQKPNHDRPNKQSGGSADLQSSSSYSKSTSARIDPVLLTKSDELVRAEIRLKRERIEKVLREQLERKRNDSGQSIFYQENVPEFDVSDVLAKALANLKPATAVETHNGTNTTDSVDENSFYSSKQNESSSGAGDDPPDDHSEQATKKVEDRDARSTSVTQPIPYELNITEAPPSDLIREDGPSEIGQENKPPRNDYVNEEHNGRNQVFRYGEEPHVRSEHLETLEDSRERIDTTSARLQYNLNAFNRNASHIGLRDRPLEEPVRRLKDEGPPRGAGHESFRETIHTSRPSPDVPVIRSTIRSPVAPQPARVSPLAVNRLPAAGLDVRHREEAVSRPLSSGQSPESPHHHSPTLHPPKRRRVVETNERSRKAPLRRVARSPEPFIKQEPNSPPPFSFSDGPPHQRYRRVDREREPDRHDALGVYSTLREERPARHEQDTPSTAHFSGTFPRSHKHRADFHRYASMQLPGEPRSPLPSHPVYSPSERRPVRAVSQTYYERPAAEIIHYYRDDVGPPLRGQYIRADRSRTPPALQEMISPSQRRPVVMAPPSHAHPVRRVTVDESGRYFEAPPTTYVRQSMVPTSGHSLVSSTRPRETGPFYEHIQVPVRVSDDSYPEHRFIERSAASPPPLGRRMTTQPDENDFRPYRHRDYSAHPADVVVPREQYMYAAREIRERGGPREPYDEVIVPRNYIQRLPSVRPEEVRYRLSPQERVSRLQSSHGGDRAYSTSGGGGGRFETLPQGTIRDYSVRPEEDLRGYVPAAAAAQTERYTYLPAEQTAARRYVDEIRYM
ncbi:MAG: hypothetical protein M1816_006078 [Peltula sp. TS41687]|nr:MAG: hypothetical protein M1816_006078 [Peltula sp. TS41687]